MPHLDGVNDGVGYGVKGVNTTPTSLGHFHEAGVVGTSQGGVGVFGTSGDIFRFGPFGSANIGVQGASPDGTGVSGHSGTGHGVSGFSDSGTGVQGIGITGVKGTGGTHGVFGESSGGDGVVGLCTSNAHAGVSATNDSSGFGVWARGTPSGYFECKSNAHAAVSAVNEGGGYGVSGSTSSATVGGAGVWGNNASSGYGVRGTGGTGVHGEGSEYAGVEGTGKGLFGVYGEVAEGLAAVEGYNAGSYAADGVHGDGGTLGNGVSGRSVNGAGILGFSEGSGPAGYLVGKVVIFGDLFVSGKIVNLDLDAKLAALGIPQPDVSQTGSGSGLPQPGGSDNFVIDHPLDPASKLLSHAAVKSPDMKNVYDGVVVLNANGEAVIQLPEWFGALNDNVRYQLTPIGGSGPNLHVASKINNNSFRIAGGSPGMEVSWQVTGIRKDPYAQSNRVIVEKDKDVKERGYYVHPEAYAQPAGRDVRWILNPEWMQRLQEIREAPDVTRRLAPQRDPELERRLSRPRPSRRG